jgi:MFS transporter, NNP family, nitrate/nitrite transporter
MGTPANRNLALATVAFAVSFAVWGLISGLAPLFKAQYGLTATQTSLMVAIPVLLGSLGRIPMGLLTDKYGGRIVFSALLIFGIVPAAVLAIDHSYSALLLWGFFIGLAGSSFAVGVGFVSPWFAAQKQGLALGIYGAGNIGQSVAVFGAPMLAANIGIAATFPVFGVASLLWGIVFYLFSRNAPRTGPPRTLADSLNALRTERVSWLLSTFYFLTFGGFVAMGVFLPTLLRDQFQLQPADAGARTAGFVIVATACRPLGGWLSDRLTGQVLLRYVFVGLIVAAALLIPATIDTFTIGALGGAILLGLGNGGVFKLVPQFFPKQTGTITGLVGAAGGLGGFFPPLALGVFKDATGSYAIGFALLGVFALGCLAILLLAPAMRIGRAPVEQPS